MTDETFVNLAPRELEEDPYIYGVEVATAADNFLNALLGGWHHETLSSRTWRAWKMRRVFGLIFRPIIDTIFWIQNRDFHHCQRHHEMEVARASKIVLARKSHDPKL